MQDSHSSSVGAMQSPRRVAVPVLVRDGKPCGAKPPGSYLFDTGRDKTHGVPFSVPPYSHHLMPPTRGWWPIA